MAFGDKVSWDQPKTFSFKDVIGTVQSTSIEFVPVDDKPRRTPAVVEPVKCCDDSYNFSVEIGTGVPFCLKCRKPMTVEHFNSVLDAYAERMKASR